MASRNVKKYMKDAIDSVYRQTSSSCKLVIVGDGSTNDALEIVQSFKDLRVIDISPSHNKGVVEARKIALKIRGICVILSLKVKGLVRYEARFV